MEQAPPNLTALWESFTGYQRTAAIKAAIELDLFSRIAKGDDTVAALAQSADASTRGVRILLDHLTMDGYLTRAGDRYSLTPTAAAFLDRSSPAYVGSAITFLASPMIMQAFHTLTDAVRNGGTVIEGDGSLAPEHSMWVDFARAMSPLAAMSGGLVANLLDIASRPGGKVLDVAAGHGMFGIALARQNANVHVTALDWKNVLALAEENARTAGVAERFRTLPGSAFDVDWGTGYDLVLLPNFLHHFDPPTCETILAKAKAALAPTGEVVIVEFIPDDDRSGPPDPVRFGLVMLASTPAGDAYTFAEYREMLRRVGFAEPKLHDLVPTPTRVVTAKLSGG